MIRFLLLISICCLMLCTSCSEVNSPQRDFSHEVLSLALDSQDPSVYEGEEVKLKALADSDNPLAQYRYADRLLNKGLVEEAIPYLQRSIALGEQHSAELLGILYTRSESREDDLEGFKLLTQAAESGLDTAQLYLGFCFSSDECPLPNNIELAYYWLDLAKQNGASEASLLIDDVSEKIQNKALVIQRYSENVSKVICEIDSTKC